MKTTWLPLLLICFNSYSQKDSVNFDLRILDDENGQTVFSNVRLWNSAGENFYPDSLYFWKTFLGKPFPDYPASGTFNMRLPQGKYYYEADRGPEYFLMKDSFEAVNNSISPVVRMKRLADLKKMNWWSGELHVHRKIDDIERLMKCGDLHIAPVITSWNEQYKENSKNTGVPKKFDDNRFYTSSGSEDERGGGALLVLNTAKPMDFSKDRRSEYPALAASVDEVLKLYGNKYWIDIDKPYWWDVPILLSTGKINSVGIANNHMNQGGVFDNEAWGRPRDTAQYRSPRGNGYYAQDIFYKMLNAGINIVPSAGSASGVLMNPVGYNRVYAYVKNKLTYEKWFKSVRKGRTFITNGPLLICKVDNQYPGYQFSAAKPVKLKINTEVFSRDSIESIEIIKNGALYKTLPPSTHKSEITFDKSGWFLVRVICNTPGNFRFASTAPYHVKIAGKKYISKSSAQFFMSWLDDRARSLKIADVGQAAEVNKYIDAAKIFWQQRIDSATDD